MIHPPLLEQDKLKHIPIVSLTEYTVNTLVENKKILCIFIKKTLSSRFHERVLSYYNIIICSF